MIHLLQAMFLALSVSGSEGMTASEPLRAETRVASPTVLATWIRRGPNELELLVLWRGTPYWFMRDRRRSASYGGSSDAYYAQIAYGGTQMSLEKRSDELSAVVASTRIPLPGDANVILIDRVDEERGTPAVTSFSVGTTLVQGVQQFESLLRSSPLIGAFLQCDIRSEDSRRQAVFDRLCAPLKVK
jgi:hypothetical protein